MGRCSEILIQDGEVNGILRKIEAIPRVRELLKLPAQHDDTPVEYELLLSAHELVSSGFATTTSVLPGLQTMTTNLINKAPRSCRAGPPPVNATYTELMDSNNTNNGSNTNNNTNTTLLNNIDPAFPTGTTPTAGGSGASSATEDAGVDFTEKELDYWNIFAVPQDDDPSRRLPLCNSEILVDQSSTLQVNQFLQ